MHEKIMFEKVSCVSLSQLPKQTCIVNFSDAAERLHRKSATSVY